MGSLDERTVCGIGSAAIYRAAYNGISSDYVYVRYI